MTNDDDDDEDAKKKMKQKQILKEIFRIHFLSAELIRILFVPVNPDYSFCENTGKYDFTRKFLI